MAKKEKGPVALWRDEDEDARLARIAAMAIEMTRSSLRTDDGDIYGNEAAIDNLRGRAFTKDQAAKGISIIKESQCVCESENQGGENGEEGK